MDKDKDRQLIEAILKGQEKALYFFYQKFKPSVWRLIRARINSQADAEEILQDTLLAVLEGLIDFNYRSSLKTFVMAIARRKIVDYYRRKKLKTIVFSKIPQVEQYLALLKNPEAILEEKLLSERIKRVLRRIRPRYRLLLKLKYIEEFRIKEIAGKFKQSVKAIESRLFRARKSFAKLYEQESEIDFERPAETAAP